MQASSAYYEKLQPTYDSIEKHLRSLEALGMNIENNLMMSLIQSNFPKHALARLEKNKKMMILGRSETLGRNSKSTFWQKK